MRTLWPQVHHSSNHVLLILYNYLYIKIIFGQCILIIVLISSLNSFQVLPTQLHVLSVSVAIPGRPDCFLKGKWRKSGSGREWKCRRDREEKIQNEQKTDDISFLKCLLRNEHVHHTPRVYYFRFFLPLHSLLPISALVPRLTRPKLRNLKLQTCVCSVRRSQAFLGLSGYFLEMRADEIYEESNAFPWRYCDQS